MTFSFDQIPLKVIPHFKDGAGEAHTRIREDAHGKIMHCTLPPGSSIGPHTHQGSYEVMYFLSGTGLCLDDGEEIAIVPGLCHYCPAGHHHSVINTGDVPLVLFAVIPNC